MINSGAHSSMIRYCADRWQPRTIRGHQYKLQWWFRYNRFTKGDNWSITPEKVIPFLVYLFEKEGKTVRSLMNSLKVMRILCDASGHPFTSEQNVRIKALFKGMLARKPDTPIARAHKKVWDVSCLLDFFVSWKQNSDLNLRQLGGKLCALILLATMRRSVDLTQLNTHLLRWSSDHTSCSFHLPQPTKSYRPNTKFTRAVELQNLQLTSYPIKKPGDKQLCPIKCLKHYLKRTESLRHDHTQLLIISCSPFTPASSSTVAGWLKEIMQSAGIDLNHFGPGSFRSASSSKAYSVGISVQTIMQMAGWSHVNTFITHYLKNVEAVDRPKPAGAPPPLLTRNPFYNPNVNTPPCRVKPLILPPPVESSCNQRMRAFAGLWEQPPDPTLTPLPTPAPSFTCTSGNSLATIPEGDSKAPSPPNGGGMAIDHDMEISIPNLDGEQLPWEQITPSLLPQVERGGGQDLRGPILPSPPWRFKDKLVEQGELEVTEVEVVVPPPPGWEDPGVETASLPVTLTPVEETESSGGLPPISSFRIVSDPPASVSPPFQSSSMYRIPTGTIMTSTLATDQIVEIEVDTADSTGEPIELPIRQVMDTDTNSGFSVYKLVTLQPAASPGHVLPKNQVVHEEVQIQENNNVDNTQDSDLVQNTKLKGGGTVDSSEFEEVTCHGILSDSDEDADMPVLHPPIKKPKVNLGKSSEDLGVVLGPQDPPDIDMLSEQVAAYGVQFLGDQQVQVDDSGSGSESVYQDGATGVSGMKLWKCKLCGRSYGRKHHLIHHINMHKGYRPHKCGHCKKSFFYKSSYNRHTKFGCIDLRNSMMETTGF